MGNRFHHYNRGLLNFVRLRDRSATSGFLDGPLLNAREYARNENADWAHHFAKAELYDHQVVWKSDEKKLICAKFVLNRGYSLRTILLAHVHVKLVDKYNSR